MTDRSKVISKFESVKFDFDQLPKGNPLEEVLNTMNHEIADAAQQRAQRARWRANRARPSSTSNANAPNNGQEQSDEDSMPDPPPHEDFPTFTHPQRSKSFRDTINNHYSKAQLGDVYDKRTFINERDPARDKLTPLEIMGLISYVVFALGFLIFAVLAAYLVFNNFKGMEREHPSTVLHATTVGLGQPQIAEISGSAPSTPYIAGQELHEDD
ncbi:hypothetical protein LTR05_002825 [Lithohypha guttulata]|uniref:Uncharacterized protein n=1 Tax=Lithohypha guttulata TaxID=1690604 RepID=A0AAN7YCM6_9EURO|nr:hypothetical protein LTR05_002825 [Lithohypha guttulata]